jgi:hypothetical protein
MARQTIDTPPAELRKLVPKLARQIEELEGCAPRPRRPQR